MGEVQSMFDEKIHSRCNDKVYIKKLLSSRWLMFYSAYRVDFEFKDLLELKTNKNLKNVF